MTKNNKSLKQTIIRKYTLPALTTDFARRMLQKCPDGEFRRTQYEEVLLEWAIDNPIYTTPKKQKCVDPHEVTNIFCTDWSIVGIVKEKINELLHEYLKQKEVRDIEYGRQKFENIPLPTKKEALHAFTWYVCPSAKQALETNLMKFDAFNKHLSNTILGTNYRINPTALFLYSGKNQTGKSYRLDAMIDTVADIGFPVKKCNEPDFFERGFHEADDYCSGLMAVSEWDNKVNIDSSLYKTLVEQETIRINRKNKSRLVLDVKGCFVIASNDLPKMGAERRTSIVEFADDEFRLDDNSPEYVPTDKKKALYQAILKTYKAYIDTTGDVFGSFFKLGITETMRDLNSKKINSATVDSFCAYLGSSETLHIKRPNFVKWICVNKHKGYKYNTRDFNAMLDDLVEGGYLVQIDQNSYEIKTNTDAIVDFLKSTASTKRFTYEEVYKKLESILDLSFLPDDNDGDGLNEETHSFVSYDLHKANPKGEFEVLNEFISEEPTPGHKTPRSQDNCKLNRFLYEFDDMPLEEQKKLIDTQKENLYRVTYSGNKSYHSIVSVKRPPQTREQYKWLWGYIAKHLGFLDYADPACNDNSRLTRKPGVVRKDKKKEQTLIYDDRNILDIDWIDDWCSEAAMKDLSAISRANMGYGGDNNFASFVSGWMKKNNVVYKPGNRHNTLCRVRGALKAASIEYTEQDLIDYGFEEEIVKETENIKE